MEADTPAVVDHPLPTSVIARSSHSPAPRGIQYRYVLIALGFFGLMCVYAMRVNLNVAIVSMVNHSAINEVTKDSQCMNYRTELSHRVSANISSSGINSSPAKKLPDGPFEWNPYIQGIILGSFYWGYTVTPIPGGMLSHRFGAKWLFGVGTVMTGVLSILIPLVTTHLSYSGLIIVRLLQGLGEGVTYPAVEVQIAHWIPKTGRATAVTVIHAGGYVGIVLGMLISGNLAASTFLGGWPSVFYVFGTVTMVWFLLWVLLTSDTPDVHPFISVDELAFIHDSLGDQRPTVVALSQTPWRAILTSPAAWSVYLAYVGSMWIAHTVITELPTYFGTVLGYDIRTNGLYSALPHIGATVISSLTGITSDYIVRQQWLTLTCTRKLITATSLFVPSLICFIVVTVAGCNGTITLILFVIAGSIRGMAEAGAGPVPIDMAPDFAGIVYGVGIAICSLTGIIVPYVTGALIQYENSTRNWQYSFWIAGVVGFVSATFFVVFGTAEVQPWGTYRPDEADSRMDLEKKIAPRICTDC